MCKKRLWRRESPCIGLRWGTWKGTHILGTLKYQRRRAVGVGASLYEGALCGEPGERAPLLGTPKNMLSEALEMCVCFHCGIAFGEHGGTLLF